MSFVSTIPTRHPNLVFYVATPSHIISSSSTTLRQILSAVRRLYKAHPEGDILVHFVPESLIFGNHPHPASKLEGLDTFVCSVYDRVLRPVTRAMSRKFFNWSAPIVGYFEAPAYSLVSSPSGKARHGIPHPTVFYTLEPSASALDVIHRHMLLHVGYQVSACGRWIMAACVDAEGEAHELKTWLTPEDNVEAFVAAEVWKFGHEFAQRANIEWRIVICKLGLMAHSELEGMSSLLPQQASAHLLWAHSLDLSPGGCCYRISRYSACPRHPPYCRQRESMDIPLFLRRKLLRHLEAHPEHCPAGSHVEVARQPYYVL